MSLFYRLTGNGSKAVVIIHGLYGSSDNWMSIARYLSNHFFVIVPDMRNHGRSFHHPVHTYSAMAADLNELLNSLHIAKVHIIGHSMGGKVAMRFVIDFPSKIDRLTVLDIAPKKYELITDNCDIWLNHSFILNALASCNVLHTGINSSRSIIDTMLAVNITDTTLRSFLMKNLYRNKAGHFNWRINIESLKTNMDELLDGFSLLTPLADKMPDALFIKGENSSYIANGDTLHINKFFPHSKVVTLHNTGHCLHTEKPDLLAKMIIDFFSF